MIFKWHEQATELRHSDHFHNLPNGLTKGYISGYRRILKMILEKGCMVNMSTCEKEKELLRIRAEPVVDNLLYLGQMILGFGESIAEQDMVEDISDVTFDENGLYIQQRRHHYEVIFNHISRVADKKICGLINATSLTRLTNRYRF